MIAIFSDLHLKNKNDPRLDLFSKSLKKLQSQGLTELWLLGDIFDLMVGPYSFWTRKHSNIFKILESLAQQGCKILWLEGNHDFDLQAALKNSGITVVDGEIQKTLLGGQKLWLAHGDLVDSTDTAYLKWRATTRNPKFRKVLSQIPEFFAEYALLPLAEAASHTSRQQHSDPEAEIRTLYRTYAKGLFAKGFDGVFLGHCHVEDMWVHDNQFYLNLGSWLGSSRPIGLWNPRSEPFPKIISCETLLKDV
jgi:UDP-2,3-diacylglucosamine hydrolase